MVKVKKTARVGRKERLAKISTEKQQREERDEERVKWVGKFIRRPERPCNKQPDQGKMQITGLIINIYQKSTELLIRKNAIPKASKRGGLRV